MIRYIIRFLQLTVAAILILAAGYAVLNYKLVVYGWHQLKGQLHIIMEARPVDACLSDPAFPDSLKKKLLFIREVRQYATDSLGLDDSKNYTSLYDQHGKPSLWVITACQPYSLTAYEWEFPLLGSVSYKGFFEKERGLPEAENLRKQGYDVSYHPTGGWSTLGWFRDPILSNMLRKNEGQLAELIIHELSHATLYLPGSVDYNENFATFTGEQGALLFLASKYGEQSEQYTRYRKEQADEEKFGAYMLSGCSRLDSLYRTLLIDSNTEMSKQKKTSMIRSIIQNISNLNLNYPENYITFTADSLLPNNCFFMSYRRYRKNQTEFMADYRQTGSNMKLWINNLRTKTRE